MQETKKGHKCQRQIGSGHIPASTYLHSFTLPNTFTNIQRKKKIHWCMLNILGYFLKAADEKASPVVNNEN